MLKTAQTHIANAARVLKVSNKDLNKLLKLEAEHNFVIKLDNGDELNAYRMQHSSIRGPYKGGIRYHPDLDADEVRALATLMSFKTSALNLPLGGGKGGVEVSPKELSKDVLEEISRKYVRGIVKFIGPHKDVPAPDVNTNSETMDWMADEYSKLTGDKTKASFTGKSIENGGSEGRREATGRGGVIVLETILGLLGDESNKKKTYAIQGFGNAGLYFAKTIAELKLPWKLVAVTDSSGGVFDEKGLNVKDISKWKQDGNKLVDFGQGDKISNKQLIETEVNVLILAALGGVITSDNAINIKSEYVLELANGPIEAGAEEILLNKGIQVIPDILANAGGVVVSYLEWYQNIESEHWTLEEVNSKLQTYMETATNDIVNISLDESISLKEAAFALAIQRLLIIHE